MDKGREQESLRGGPVDQKNNDALEEMIRSWCRGARSDPLRSGCPADDLLAAYIGGELAEEDRHTVDQHLARCESCLEETLLVRRALRTEQASVEQVPSGIVDKATSIVSPARASDVFDITIQITDKTMQLLSTTGVLLPSEPPMTVRRESRTIDPNLVRIAKTIDDFRVMVELQLVPDTLCNIIVRVQRASESEVDSLRVVLTHGARELASLRTRGHAVLFERLRRGAYALSIWDTDRTAGPIKLTIL